MSMFLMYIRFLPGYVGTREIEMITTQVDIIKKDIRIMMVTIDSVIDVITVVRDRNEDGDDWLAYDDLVDSLADAKKNLERSLEYYNSLHKGERKSF